MYGRKVQTLNSRQLLHAEHGLGPVMPDVGALLNRGPTEQVLSSYSACESLVILCTLVSVTQRTHVP